MFFLSHPTTSEQTRQTMCSPSQTQLDDAAVQNFREYLRIPSVHPDVNYDDCVAFLRRQAESLDLPIQVVEHDKGKPFVIITWLGTEPSKSSILLNSHMDVVPVSADKWTHPPFSAHMDEAGDIHARGSQDMKCVGIQYLEAIRRLKLKNERLKRTVHLFFVPDEEITGIYGTQKFVKTEDFKKLQVGFALDEGIARPTNDFYLFNGDRSTWHVWVHCPGDPGHGFLMKKNNAGEKIRVVIDRFMNFRTKEMAKLETGKYKLGDVLSVNLTQLRGGVQTNVVPEELIVAFDLRLPPTADHNDVENMIRGWCQEAGDDVYFTFETKVPKGKTTKLDSSNPFWTAFKATSDKMGLKLHPEINPARADGFFFRLIGIPAIGFSPMYDTQSRLHDHNEYLNKNVFLRGIEIYMNLIPAVANV